jgi:large subunit ribosomal protein L19
MKKEVQLIEEKYKKKEKPNVQIGDVIIIQYLIPEGNKERLQKIEGIVIAKKHGGINETVTIRRNLDNVGFEQVFLLHSPKLVNIYVKQHSFVRRAKLYYLRTAKGKSAKLTQKF